MYVHAVDLQWTCSRLSLPLGVLSSIFKVNARDGYPSSSCMAWFDLDRLAQWLGCLSGCLLFWGVCMFVQRSGVVV